MSGISGSPIQVWGYGDNAEWEYEEEAHEDEEEAHEDEEELRRGPFPPSPPSFSPMSMSKSNLVYAGRTTSCDIMSTINTSCIFKKSATSPEKGSPFRATLPYKKSKQRLGATLAADTHFTKLQLFKTQRERNTRMIVERNYFMNELQLDRSGEEWNQHQSAIKIQACFRGFRVRPRSFERYERHRRMKQVRNSVEEIRRELCAHAKLLNLGTIRGLTLEPVDRESRRMHKILRAAAMRVVRFFRMIVARRKALRRLDLRREEIRNMMAKRIVRFFKYIFLVSFTKKAERIKRNAKAVFIQTGVRSFLARKRVRHLKKSKILTKRQNHSSTIITRNYAPYVKRLVIEREKPIESLADLLMDRYLFDECFDKLLSDTVTTESKSMYQTELVTQSTDIAFDTVNSETVELVLASEIGVYVDEQIRILEEIRLQLEKERLALEEERLRLQEEIDRSQREEEERKRKEAERLMKQAEVRRLAEKARLEAEKDAQRQALMREKARQLVESQGQVQAQAQAQVNESEGDLQQDGEKKAIYMSTDSVNEALADEVTLLNELKIHEGTAAERIDRAKMLKRFNRFALCIEILSQLLVQLIREESHLAADDGDQVKVGAHGDRLLRLAEISVLIAQSHFELGEFTLAGEKLVYAEEIREKVVGRRHVLVAEVEISLANIYSAQGHFSDAEASYNEAISILEEADARKEESQSDKLADLSSEEIVTIPKLFCAVYVGLAELQHSVGNYELCIESIDNGLNIAETRFVETDKTRKVLMANCLDIHGLMLATQGLVQDAIATYKEALDLYLDAFGTDEHPLVASSMTKLGGFFLKICDMSSAKQYFDKGLEIRQIFFNDDHLSIAESHFMLAEWFCATGKYQKARTSMQKALEVRQKLLGPRTHHLIALTFQGLAEIVSNEGFPVDALSIYESALGMFRECFPSTRNDNGSDSNIDEEDFPHLSVARCMWSLGLNLIQCGRMDEAFSMIQNAQQMRTANLTSLDVDSHWEISEGNIGLAHCLLHVGKFKEAKLMLVEAGKALVGVFGAQHLLVAEGLFSLGKVCSASGLYKDATVLYQRCLHQQLEILGVDSLRLLSTYNAMALNFLGPGGYDEAIASCNKSIEVLSAAAAGVENEQPMSSSLLTVQVLRVRAQILRDTGTLGDAQLLYEQGLLLVREMFGGSDTSTLFAELIGELGECLRLQGKASQAELAIDESLRLRIEHFGETHALVSDALRYKALLLLDNSQPDEAADLLEDKLLPIMKTYYGHVNEHPVEIFVTGLIGVCLKEIHNKEFLTIPTADADSREKLDYAQSMIDDALDFFDVYQQGCFDDLHPWVLRLGGFASTMASPNDSRASTARSRTSTPSYLSLRVNTSLSSRPHTMASAISIAEEEEREFIPLPNPDSPDRFSQLLVEED